MTSVLSQLFRTPISSSFAIFLFPYFLFFHIFILRRNRSVVVNSIIFLRHFHPLSCPLSRPVFISASLLHLHLFPFLVSLSSSRLISIVRIPSFFTSIFPQYLFFIVLLFPLLFVVTLRRFHLAHVH